MLISEEELNAYLESLKTTMRSFDYTLVQNVIFFNLESLYEYFNPMSCQCKNDQYSIGEIMDILEPYIPFALTSSTIDYFLQATNATDDFSFFENKFNKNARMDFLNAVRCVSSENDWNYIKETCQYLRKHEEKIYQKQAF